MWLERLVSFFSLFIPYPSLSEKHRFSEWKQKVLLVTLGAFVMLGPVAFLPGVLFAIKYEIWSLAIADTLIYGALLFLTFSKRISGDYKILFSISLFYFIALTVFLTVGSRGQGYNWMFIFVLVAVYFYGYRGLLVGLGTALITFLVLLLGLLLGPTWASPLLDFGTVGWVTNIFIFSAVTIFFAILLNELLEFLYQSLDKEKEYSRLLKRNQLVLEEQRKRAEDSDRLKSLFLANMSHEIRTPMNAVLGFSELLGDPDVTPEQAAEYREIIYGSGMQLLRLIDDIIDISKIESNQLRIDPVPTNLLAAIQEVEAMARNKIRMLGKPLELKKCIEGIAPDLLIETDEVRLKQILVNLTDNAIKYSDKGVIELGCAIDEGEQGEEVLRLFVRDQGRGIPEKDRQRIFERFGQASNIQFKMGTGLGLSIVSGLLRLMGGSIELETKEQVGSLFVVKLPLVKVGGASLVQQRVVNKLAIPDLRDRLVFIAEDDENSWRLLEQILKPTGAVIHHVFNGAALLKALDSAMPDLIFMDVNMPVLDGMEAMQKVRMRFPTLPVIAQTAFAMAQEREKCLRIGFDEYLAKPLSRIQVYEALNKVLKK